jgi:hypothetical protein
MCSRTWPPGSMPSTGRSCALSKRGIEHAITAGNLLIEAKAKLNKHGQWLPWLREHCTMSERTAQLYMRLARFAPELQAKSASLADLTIERAVSLIADRRTREGRGRSARTGPPIPRNFPLRARRHSRAGFVLSRQEPAGKWTAATYALAMAAAPGA